MKLTGKHYLWWYVRELATALRDLLVRH